MSTTKESAHVATSRDVLAKAEVLLPEIRDAADEIDEARRLPDWLAKRLSDAGLFHLLTGVEHGGLAADPVTAAKAIEKLSTASPSVGWVTMILATASFWTVRMAPEEVRREIFAAVAPGEIQPTVIAGHAGSPRSGRTRRGGLEAERAVALRQRLSPRHVDAHRRLAIR